MLLPVLDVCIYIKWSRSVIFSVIVLWQNVKRTHVLVYAGSILQCNPTGHFFVQVGKRSPNLCRLHLVQVNLTHLPIAHLPNSLESLAITESYLPGGWFYCQGTTVLPRLKELDLSKSGKTSNPDIATIVQAWPDLTTLKLNYCYRINSECLQSATERLHHLEVLEVAGTACDDVAIHHICRNLAVTLRHLNVAECPQFTDGCAGTVVTLLTNLLSLDVSKCCQLTDSGLLSFAKMNSRLQYLNVLSTAISSDTLLQLKTSLPHCKIVHDAWVTYYRVISMFFVCELIVNI